MHLIVIRPFGQFVRGDVISDPASISQILNGQHARFVIRVASHTGGKD
jgi:hypothetical protein